MAERIDITHDQGATFERRFIWKLDPDDPEIVDVSGYAARMHIRSAVAAEEILLELTTENDRIFLGGPLGTVDLHLEPEATTDLAAPATYRYDLEMVAPGGHVTRLIEGKFRLRPEVTR
jgi:hypothetical protein